MEGESLQYLYAQRRIIPPVHVQGVRDYPTSRASNFSWSLESRWVISSHSMVTYGAATKGFSKFLILSEAESRVSAVRNDTDKQRNSIPRRITVTRCCARVSPRGCLANPGLPFGDDRTCETDTRTSFSGYDVASRARDPSDCVSVVEEVETSLSRHFRAF